MLILQLALENSLRYFPPHLHSILAPEFAKELRLYGHVYMYRFRPEVEMRSVQSHCAIDVVGAFYLLERVMSKTWPCVPCDRQRERRDGNG